MTNALQILWVECGSGRSGSELFEECRRICTAGKCPPAQATQWLEATRPSAVVFEFTEPLAAHLQILRSVKRQYPSIPILMITESRGEELAVWAFRARVWNYLVKPVALRELRGNVSQLIRVAAERASGESRRVERPGAVLPAAYSAPAPQSEAAAVQQIAEQIRRNHTGKLSISKMARECHMSRYAFSRLFSKTFGCSCREYVTKLRIETACAMLSSGEASVSSVAAAAGFSDASYFARMFRRHIGMSPSQYAGTLEHLPDKEVRLSA